MKTKITVKRLLSSHHNLISRKLLHIFVISQTTEQHHRKDRKFFRKVSLSTEFTSLQETINSYLELLVNHEEILIQNC